MNSFVKKILLCFLFFSFMLLVSCTKDNTKSLNKRIIKIGVFEPLSGVDSVVGVKEAYGIEYANEIYDIVEIDGVTYDIELVEIDNESNVNDSKSFAQKLVNENVDFVLGGYDANISLDASNVFEKEKIPFINCSATNVDIVKNKKYCFLQSPDDVFIGSVAANHINNSGVCNVVVISDTADKNYSSIVKYFKAACNGFGINVVDDVVLPSDASKYKNILMNIKDKMPEYIFLSTSLANSSYVVKLLREVGVNCKIFSRDMWEYDAIISKAYNECEDIDFISFFDKTNLVTQTTEFFIYGDGIKRGFVDYLKEKNESEYIHSVSALGYDAYLAIYYALQDANSMDKELVLESLKNIKYEGCMGIVAYNNGVNSNKSILIKNIKNGIPEYSDICYNLN